jgi:hypothetical protein
MARGMKWAAPAEALSTQNYPKHKQSTPAKLELTPLSGFARRWLLTGSLVTSRAW